jgi:hypothetical protein
MTGAKFDNPFTFSQDSRAFDFRAARAAGNRRSGSGSGARGVRKQAVSDNPRSLFLTAVSLHSTASVRSTVLPRRDCLPDSIGAFAGAVRKGLLLLVFGTVNLDVSIGLLGSNNASMLEGKYCFRKGAFEKSGTVWCILRDSRADKVCL